MKFEENQYVLINNWFSVFLKILFKSLLRTKSLYIHRSLLFFHSCFISLSFVGDNLNFHNFATNFMWIFTNFSMNTLIFLRSPPTHPHFHTHLSKHFRWTIVIKGHSLSLFPTLHPWILRSDGLLNMSIKQRSVLIL